MELVAGREALNPALGLLCFGCPAILTSFPNGQYHVREIWSGREYTTTLAVARLTLELRELKGPGAVAPDPIARS